MTKTAAQTESRRPKPMSPDVLEILHMLAALESQTRPQQNTPAGE